MLVADWRKVLRKAWSVRLMALCGVLLTAEQIVPYIAFFLPWWVPVLVILAAALARLISQKDFAE